MTSILDVLGKVKKGIARRRASKAREVLAAAKRDRDVARLGVERVRQYGEALKGADGYERAEHLRSLMRADARLDEAERSVMDAEADAKKQSALE